MSTQKAMFSYDEVIDLHTESDRVSVIGIHTPTGDTPRRLCPGFFQQFKKYKYLGCKIALVPAATLPADPSQISYGAGEAPIDMRDVLNPILFHGCHGNDLGDILNRLYAANAVTGDSTTMHLGSDAVDVLTYLNGDLFGDWDSLESNISFMESLYYRALTDRTWKKANVQRGFRISGLRPRVYSLASTMQISGVASLDNIGNVPAPFEIDGEWTGSIQSGIEGSVQIDNPLSNANRFLTPRTIPLGWLDTRNVLTFRDPASVELENGDVGLAPNVLNNMVKQGTVPVELPKIFMGVILLPPAYKQEFYFRMIVTHFFAFAGFRGCSMSNDMLENPNYHDWNEQITSGSGDDPEPDPEPESLSIVAPTSAAVTLDSSNIPGIAYSMVLYDEAVLSDDSVVPFSNPYVATLSISGKTDRYYYLGVASNGDKYLVCAGAESDNSSTRGFTYLYNPADGYWYSRKSSNEAYRIVSGYEALQPADTSLPFTAEQIADWVTPW